MNHAALAVEEVDEPARSSFSSRLVFKLLPLSFDRRVCFGVYWVNGSKQMNRSLSDLPDRGRCHVW